MFAGRGKETLQRWKAVSRELDKCGRWMALQRGWFKPDLDDEAVTRSDGIVHTEL